MRDLLSSTVLGLVIALYLLAALLCGLAPVGVALLMVLGFAVAVHALPRLVKRLRQSRRRWRARRLAR